MPILYALKAGSRGYYPEIRYRFHGGVTANTAQHI